MDPKYDDRAPRARRMTMQERLVDIDLEQPQTQAPAAGSTPQRKRLSDVECRENEAQPPASDRPARRSLATRAADTQEVRRETRTKQEPQDHSLPAVGADESQPPAPPRRRSLGLGRNDTPELPRESPPESGPRRARLVLESPAKAEEPPVTATPRRPRGAVTAPDDGVPGLQNIIGRPRRLEEILVPVETTASAPAESADPAQIGPGMAELRAKENFPVALVGGLVAAVVGAIAWALVTVATNYQIAWMAVGVGFLVGGTVRTLGRSIDKSFGHLGAALSVFGCLLGNLLSICMVVAGQEAVGPLAMLAYVGGHPAIIPGALIAAFHPLDLLFYGIAVYEGYQFSFRRVGAAELHDTVDGH